MDGHFLARLKLNGIFCQVVDCGSMGKAAQSLGMTTSAVSQHISRLETELGMTLLNRTTRKLNLSEAGERYYAKGKAALEAAKAAENAVHEIKHSLAGTLRIALPVGLSTQPIAQALSSLIIDNPDLKIRMFATDETIDPIAERIDIVINVGTPKDSQLYFYPLGQSGKHIYASPLYLARRGYPTHPDDLLQHTWLGLGFKGVLSGVSLTCEEHTRTNIKPTLQMEFNDLNSLISHVTQGLGLAVLPELEIKAQRARGELVKVLPNWHIAPHPIYALTTSHHAPFKVKKVLTELKTYFAKQHQQDHNGFIHAPVD